jgi:hypothetical protein
VGLRQEFRFQQQKEFCPRMNSDTFPEISADDSNAPWTGALPTPLKRLLADELRAGNSIQYVAGCGLDPETVLLVLLAHPFHSRREPLPEKVFFRQVNTADAWPAEYYTEAPKCVLAANAAE